MRPARCCDLSKAVSMMSAPAVKFKDCLGTRVTPRSRPCRCVPFAWAGERGGGGKGKEGEGNEAKCAHFSQGRSPGPVGNSSGHGRHRGVRVAGGQPVPDTGILGT